MSHADETLFFNFLQLNGPTSPELKNDNHPVTARDEGTSLNMRRDSASSTAAGNQYKSKTIFNLRQLDKLIDHFAKEHYESLSEKQGQFGKILAT